MWIKFLGISLKGVFELFVLGFIGFLLARRKFLDDRALDFLSKLVVELTLPLMIFSHLIKNFNFSLYPQWWLYPLLSFFITILGLLVGFIFSSFLKVPQQKLEFLSLVAFQNSGYLPLVLVASILPKDKLDTMFIYIFLFLLGFNLLMWSLGVYIVGFSKKKNFELGILFSPPLIATLVGLGVVYFGLNRFIPEFVLHPLVLLGNLTLPLAILVVGGNLAQMRIERFYKKEIFLLILAKLVIMPVLGFIFLLKFKLPELMGLLLILELAVPPAVSLSLIVRHYKREDILITQGLFVTHLFCLLTLPLFLSLYFAYFMIK